MSSDNRKIKLLFFFQEETPTEYQLSEIDAMELEVYAITRVHKRLLRRILRVIENLKDKTEVPLSYVLENSGSRSGDIYNALKYLEYRQIIQLKKDIKIIQIASQTALDDLYTKINRLL
jgi:hypothetical protein